MMRGMGNMQGMMKQVQKMQKEMGEAQEKLNETEFTGSSTNNLVKVVFTGNRRMKDIQINDEVVDPEDTEMLQDLIVMAVNDVLEKIDTESEKTMGKYTKGLPF
ncbi:YbaB/EbfC family nucleoid-associated protein [Enterococcus mundtii]|uniref:YbaB/EbfC family nucleoid-associated protein n=1 Tax=Enterococcus TaxID=1350 RepID=UPI001898340A|nr:YbaB/EbfC family nucleoid-associated protein [Enterococcus mundtii]MDB7100791.1 YbaB/EbfC family nucleoid-associated protein [Enterococcus mundtii]